MRATGAAALALTVAAGAGDARADERGFPVERFRLSADGGGLLDVESAATLAPRAWSLSLWLGAADDPLVVYSVDDGERMRGSRLVDTRVGGDLVLAAGVTRWLELSASAPLVLFQDRDATSTAAVNGMLEPIGSFGLGDLRLAAKLRLLRQARHGVDVALIPAVTVPTSSSGDDYLGDSALALAPELAIGRGFGDRVRLGVNLGYRSRPMAQVADLVVDDELFAHAGLGVRVHRRVEWAVTTSLAVSASDPLTTFNQNHSELLTGPIVQLTRMQVIAAGGLGTSEGFGTPDMRVVLAARYVSRTPVTPAPVVEPVRPPADLDADDDGVLDADDRCVNEPGPLANNGCPDPDTDGDGLLDRNDACPAEPEDADAFEDDDGCPELDNDADGLADADDGCPLEPGPAANRGCPDPDRDGDTIVDRLDTCPDEPGEEKFGGCKAKPMATITEGKIAIVETVYFKTDKAIIERRSYKLLESVAAVLGAHAGIRVRVEGHTDSQGNDAYNKDLSARRAAAVRDFLIARGIDAARLDAAGFGEEQPVQDNRTKSGRAANRRVEFVIVDAGGVEVNSTSGGAQDDTIEP